MQTVFITQTKKASIIIGFGDDIKLPIAEQVHEMLHNCGVEVIAVSGIWSKERVEYSNEPLLISCVTYMKQGESSLNENVVYAVPIDHAIGYAKPRKGYNFKTVESKD